MGLHEHRRSARRGQRHFGEVVGRTETSTAGIGAVSTGTSITTRDLIVVAVAILLEASILLAPTSFIGISRTWLERIRTPQHDLCNRLGADAIRSTVGLRVLATLAFAFGWRA